LVVAINEEGGNLYTDPTVRYEIDQHDRPTYRLAADFLNEADIDVINLQHEYGIFGGEWGEHVLELCRNLTKPVVSTFHTVLRKPPRKAREIGKELAELSSVVVVTIDSAATLFEKHLGVDSDKIRVIRHGAPVPERISNPYAKRHLLLQKRTVLATCGLISPGKGIEYAIKALPYLLKEKPDILYLVVGETHPEVRRHEGEAYREKLIALARALGVERNVKFIDRYLPDDELTEYLQAVDIYVAPYLGKDQVSSGTLTLALSHGKAIVATPTLFAKEILSGNRGLFCKFADAKSIAECVERILGDRSLRNRLEANAFKYGQQVGWARVADQYADAFRAAVRASETVEEAAAVSET